MQQTEQPEGGVIVSIGTTSQPSDAVAENVVAQMAATQAFKANALTLKAQERVLDQRAWASRPGPGCCGTGPPPDRSVKVPRTRRYRPQPRCHVHQAPRDEVVDAVLALPLPGHREQA